MFPVSLPVFHNYPAKPRAEIDPRGLHRHAPGEKLLLSEVFYIVVLSAEKLY